MTLAEVVVDTSVVIFALTALATRLGLPLLTADARLANAPGVTCDVELV